MTLHVVGVDFVLFAGDFVAAKANDAVPSHVYYAETLGGDETPMAGTYMLERLSCPASA